MSLNQPSPPKELSLFGKAKQTVSAATTKVTTAAIEAVEDKAHRILPPKIANLALGERRTHRDDGPSPTYPRHKPSSPEGLGIVEPDIKSATTSDPADDDDDDEDDDGPISSWEAVPPRVIHTTRTRRRRRFTVNDTEMSDSDGLRLDVSDFQFVSTCPPQVAEEMTEREEWKQSLRKVREQRERGCGRGVAAAMARRGRGRPVVKNDGGSGSEDDGYVSKSSDELVREEGELVVKDPRYPYSRSWRHGVGRKTVTVPCGSREELERTYRGAESGLGGAGEPGELLEHLGASRYRPAGALVEASSSAAGDLSRYRNMGRYFRSGSVEGAPEISRGRCH